MAKYRHSLPQLEGGLFLTDGGLETTLIFHDKFELPFFAAFPLLRDPKGRAVMREYHVRYLKIARRQRLGFVLDSPTWRASSDWGERLGYSVGALARANKDAIGLMRELRDAFETTETPIVISGALGPRGDGYQAGQLMSPAEAEAYHAEQISSFAETAADMVTAFTMTNANEAMGIARAARAAGMPVVISFTLETDGRLPSGETLADAIDAVDAATGGAPAYYMINCAHPTHFEQTLAEGGPSLARLRGLRANASRRSHAELDNAEDLDDGDPAELGEQYRRLLRRYPRINILGGCCGTDDRHVACIGAACRIAA